MTIQNRPDEKVFASGAKPGEATDFPNIERGWGLTLEQTEGKPPMEWMNGAFRRIDRAVRYLMQRGLTEWTATETYPTGAYVQHGGKSYRSLIASAGVTPGTAATTWTEWGLGLASEAEVLAGTDQAKAVTSAGLNARTATEARTGLAAIASQAQANAASDHDDTRFVTPKKLWGWVKQATESMLGMAKVATQTQVNAGTDDATIVTPKKLRNALDANVLGVAQSWQSMGAYRAMNTNYTNTSGKPIAFFVLVRPSQAGVIKVSIEVNGVSAGEWQLTASGTAEGQGATAIVPAGATYKVISSQTPQQFWSWTELR